MQLRPFTAADAITVLDFIRDEQTFYFWSAGRFPRYPATPADMLAVYAGIPHFTAFTAIEDGEIVGHLTMHRTSPDTTAIRLGFILLNPQKRGKGYGKQLLRTAIEHAKTQFGATEITLGVFEDNQPARRCYEAVGFHNTGEVTLYNIRGDEWRCLDYRYMP